MAFVGGEQDRGCIAFFSSYRPPLPFHIYSSPIQPSLKQDEISMVDGETELYNYNGRAIPPATLKSILREVQLPDVDATESDVDSGRVSGLVFISERTNGLETLHLALLFNNTTDSVPEIQVFNFAEVFGTFDGVRMEDSGCFGGDYLVYVSTMEPVEHRRQPWTAVYKTNLWAGETQRLTPPELADLSPSVSPSGKKIAVASFQSKVGGWTGEIEDLKTNIFIMDIDDPSSRTKVVENGGWPTWGSEDVLFFHRKAGDNWAVFRVDVSNNGLASDPIRVTPEGMDAITPAAVDTTTVAVAAIRQKSEFGDVRVEAQYRHIEIFDLNKEGKSMQITQKINPLVDHYNPFVIIDSHNGELRIGYHRCHDIKVEDDFKSQLQVIQSPEPDVGLFRASGVFPSFSKDGTKLAFVNNEFTIVYSQSANGVFSPFWDQNPDKDTIYVCVGNSFKADAEVEIWAIHGVSKDPPYNTVQLTTGGYNNAFPSTNPEGTRLVFRSTRDWMSIEKAQRHKNLYIMENTEVGEFGGKITRLTNGPWTDTHCEWSPNGKWIVFASTCDKPTNAPDSDNGLDPGYFAVFLVNPNDPHPHPVRVIGSGPDLAGHVNHPFFSPDGRSIVVVSDLAAVSIEPISLPHFLHSVRPYGDIFIIDIDPDNIHKNKNVKHFKRITHTRFENSTATWAKVTIKEMQDLWEKFLFNYDSFAPHCPFLHHHGGHGFHLTGHLCIPDRRC